jgi:hypothetical protein
LSRRIRAYLKPYFKKEWRVAVNGRDNPRHETGPPKQSAGDIRASIKNFLKGLKPAHVRESALSPSIIDKMVDGIYTAMLHNPVLKDIGPNMLTTGSAAHLNEFMETVREEFVKSASKSDIAKIRAGDKPPEQENLLSEADKRRQDWERLRRANYHSAEFGKAIESLGLGAALSAWVERRQKEQRRRDSQLAAQDTAYSVAALMAYAFYPSYKSSGSAASYSSSPNYYTRAYGANWNTNNYERVWQDTRRQMNAEISRQTAPADEFGRMVRDYSLNDPHRFAALEEAGKVLAAPPEDLKTPGSRAAAGDFTLDERNKTPWKAPAGFEEVDTADGKKFIKGTTLFDPATGKMLDAAKGREFFPDKDGFYATEDGKFFDPEKGVVVDVKPAAPSVTPDKLAMAEPPKTTGAAPDGKMVAATETGEKSVLLAEPAKTGAPLAADAAASKAATPFAVAETPDAALKSGRSPAGLSPAARAMLASARARVAEAAQGAPAAKDVSAAPAGETIKTSAAPVETAAVESKVESRAKAAPVEAPAKTTLAESSAVTAKVEAPVEVSAGKTIAPKAAAVGATVDAMVGGKNEDEEKQKARPKADVHAEVAEEHAPAASEPSHAVKAAAVAPKTVAAAGAGVIVAEAAAPPSPAEARTAVSGMPHNPRLNRVMHAGGTASGVMSGYAAGNMLAGTDQEYNRALEKGGAEATIARTKLNLHIATAATSLSDTALLVKPGLQTMEGARGMALRGASKVALPLGGALALSDVIEGGVSGDSKKMVAGSVGVATVAASAGIAFSWTGPGAGVAMLVGVGGTILAHKLSESDSARYAANAISNWAKLDTGTRVNHEIEARFGEDVARILKTQKDQFGKFSDADLVRDMAEYAGKDGDNSKAVYRVLQAELLRRKTEKDIDTAKAKGGLTGNYSLTETYSQEATQKIVEDVAKGDEIKTRGGLNADQIRLAKEGPQDKEALEKKENTAFTEAARVKIEGQPDNVHVKAIADAKVAQAAAEAARMAKISEMSATTMGDVAMYNGTDLEDHAVKKATEDLNRAYRAAAADPAARNLLPKNYVAAFDAMKKGEVNDTNANVADQKAREANPAATAAALRDEESRAALKEAKKLRSVAGREAVGPLKELAAAQSAISQASRNKAALPEAEKRLANAYAALAEDKAGQEALKKIGGDVSAAYAETAAKRKEWEEKAKVKENEKAAPKVDVAAAVPKADAPADAAPKTGSPYAALRSPAQMMVDNAKAKLADVPEGKPVEAAEAPKSNARRFADLMAQKKKATTQELRAGLQDKGKPDVAEAPAGKDAKPPAGSSAAAVIDHGKTVAAASPVANKDAKPAAAPAAKDDKPDAEKQKAAQAVPPKKPVVSAPA